MKREVIVEVKQEEQGSESKIMALLMCSQS